MILKGCISWEGIVHTGPAPPNLLSVPPVTIAWPRFFESAIAQKFFVICDTLVGSHEWDIIEVFPSVYARRDTRRALSEGEEAVAAVRVCSPAASYDRDTRGYSGDLRRRSAPVSLSLPSPQRGACRACRGTGQHGVCPFCGYLRVLYEISRFCSHSPGVVGSVIVGSHSGGSSRYPR
jgi:hypothetical protein